MMLNVQHLRTSLSQCTYVHLLLEDTKKMQLIYTIDYLEKSHRYVHDSRFGPKLKLETVRIPCSPPWVGRTGRYVYSLGLSLLNL